jgi:hypothetical protein
MSRFNVFSLSLIARAVVITLCSLSATPASA